MKAMDLMVSTEFAPRPKLMDPIEADHMHAIITANTLAKAREANSFNYIKELNMAAYMRANRKE